MSTILERMLENCHKAGYTPTENIEKIARAKNMMFGDKYDVWRSRMAALPV